MVPRRHHLSRCRSGHVPARRRGALDDRRPIRGQRGRSGGLPVSVSAAAGHGHPRTRLAAAVVHADRHRDGDSDLGGVPGVWTCRPAAGSLAGRCVGSAAVKRQRAGDRGRVAGRRALHAGAGAIGLALATMLKIHPALAIVWYVGRGEWRLLGLVCGCNGGPDRGPAAVAAGNDRLLPERPDRDRDDPRDVIAGYRVRALDRRDGCGRDRGVGLRARADTAGCWQRCSSSSHCRAC